MSTKNPGEPDIKQRLVSELHQYMIVSFYLWVCFSTLLLYKNSLLDTNNLSLVPLGTAVVKALIIGKFILIGEATHIGVRVKPKVLLYRILWKSVVLLLMLIVFVLAEDLIMAVVHGKTMSTQITEMVAPSCLQHLAPPVIMLMVLIPMIAFEEIDHALGAGKLKGMLFGQADNSEGQ